MLIVGAAGDPYFFFSSRRRHTRSLRDWSRRVLFRSRGERFTFSFRGKSGKNHVIDVKNARLAKIVRRCKIGRASCRERGETRMGDVALKKGDSGTGAATCSDSWSWQQSFAVTLGNGH